MLMLTGNLMLLYVQVAGVAASETIYLFFLLFIFLLDWVVASYWWIMCG